MPVENKRLLIEIEKVRKDINREIINPLFSELSSDDIHPISTMIAKARGSYLKELVKLSKLSEEGTEPTVVSIKQLHNARLIYDELIKVSIALDIAVERGYVDVGHKVDGL